MTSLEYSPWRMVCPGSSSRRIHHHYCRPYSLLLFLFVTSTVNPAKTALALQSPVSSLHQTNNRPLPTIQALARRTGISSHTTTTAVRKMSVNRSSNENDNDNKRESLLVEQTIGVIGKNTSTLVSLTFFAALAYQRDAFMICFFVGSIGNAILGKLLKRILNQDRPEITTSHPNHDNNSNNIKPSDKGMPSSHAMSLGFICTFAAISAKAPLIINALLVSFVVTSLYYRVSTNLHTKEQVYVGMLLGSTNGYLWQGLTTGTLSSIPHIHLSESVSHSFLLIDGVLPAQYLLVPALVGLVVVGSFERRIGALWKKKRNISSSKVD